jgi:hypothetical protein
MFPQARGHARFPCSLQKRSKQLYSAFALNSTQPVAYNTAPGRPNSPRRRPDGLRINDHSARRLEGDPNLVPDMLCWCCRIAERRSASNLRPIAAPWSKHHRFTLLDQVGGVPRGSRQFNQNPPAVALAIPVGSHDRQLSIDTNRPAFRAESSAAAIVRTNATSVSSRAVSSLPSPSKALNARSSRVSGSSSS